MEFHTSYRQATIFDQLWLALARGLRRPAWLRGRRAWGWAFGGLALLFGVIGAAFLLGSLDAATRGDGLASLGSALLSMGVSWHFNRSALPLLRIARRRRPAIPARSQAAISQPESDAAPSAAAIEIRPLPLSVAERRVYLAGLRAAGVNVCIARALVSAGYTDGHAVRRARDTEILAIPGVGPATLRKIRVCFQDASPR